jgi:hypothetical protein
MRKLRNLLLVATMVVAATSTPNVATAQSAMYGTPYCYALDDNGGGCTDSSSLKEDFWIFFTVFTVWTLL